MTGLYSIKEELGPGSVVLVTGGTGYVGSAIVEALLRTTEARVFILARAKSGQGAPRPPALRLPTLAVRPP